jgi:hypothetical protein
MAGRRAVIPLAKPTPTDVLLKACPFLRRHRQDSWGCGDTIVFGDVATLLKRRELPDDQALQVFNCFNILADSGDGHTLEVLATGALELFNDDAESQRLARRRLQGRALSLLEEMRIHWGQPDYGGEGTA